MARRWPITEKQVQKLVLRLNPDARGRAYQPALTIRDVPSRGRSRILKGLKAGHVHHYLSDLEFFVHIFAEFALEVVDVFDQYPLLPREEPVIIALELGFKPICYPGTGTPIVMTTDLVPTVTSNGAELLLPISAKYASDLLPNDKQPMKQRRTLQKLAIEQLTWERRNCPLALCTELDLPMRVIRNIESLRPAMIAEEKDWLNPFLCDFALEFKSKWSRTSPLRDLIFSAATRLNIAVADAWVLFRRCVWLRLIPVELDSDLIHPNFPVILLPAPYVPDGESLFFRFLRRCREFDLAAQNPIAMRSGVSRRPSLIRTTGDSPHAQHQ